MAQINYPKHSPYGATPQTAWHIGRYADRRIPEHDDDIEITIEAGHNHRPDLLSDALYGTINYWWVFYRRNLGVIKDPVWDFTTGKIIVAPSLQHLQNTIG